MGPETLIPLLLSGGGSLLQASASRQQADDKRRTLNQQYARNDEATGKAIDLTQGEAKRYSPEARKAALAEQEAKTFGQTQADLTGAGGATVATAGGAGAVSDDFLKGKAQTAIDEGTRLTSIAREAAKARAPMQLGSSDSLSRASLAGNLQNIFGSNNNMASATTADADSIEEPGYGALGAIASATGGALAKGGMKTGVQWDPDGSYGRKYALGRGA